MTTNETPQNADHMMRVCYDQMLATLKTAYSLNPQTFHPAAIEQKLVHWEKAFKDAGCITGPLTSAVTEIDVSELRKTFDGPSDGEDCYCINCREKKGWCIPQYIANDNFKNGCEEPEGTPDYLNYGVHIDALTEFGRAHLADLRRENTRTASASMEAKPQAGSRPLIRHYVDEQGNEMVALAKWFYDEMVSCMPDGPPTALAGEE